MDDENEWYVLESMKTTSKPETAPENKNKDLEAEWYHLEEDGKSESSPNSKPSVVLQDSANLVDIFSDYSGFKSNVTEVGHGSSFNFSDSRLIETYSKENGQSIDVNQIARLSSASPSGLRLNLQESIDGEISEHSSTVNSLNSINSLNSNLSLDNTSTLLKRAQDLNATSVQSGNFDGNLDGLEWVNLRSDNMHEINRPEPLGLARNDKSYLQNMTNSYSQSSASAVNSSSVVTDDTQPSTSVDESSDEDQYIDEHFGSISKTKTVDTISNNSTLKVNVNAVNNHGSFGNLPSSTVEVLGDYLANTNDNVESSSDLPNTEMKELTKESLAASVNKRVGPAQDLDFQNFSSMASSLTLGSYKEISPQSHRQHETPVTKLLGPSYKQTEEFLKQLKQVNLTYGSRSSIDSPRAEWYNSLQSHQSESTLSNVRNESCQAGSSQLEYVNAQSLQYGSDAGQDDLTEQDITSASLSGSNKVKTRISNSGESSDDSVHTDDGKLLVKNVSQSSDSKAESEGEMQLSEITDPLINTSNKSSSLSSINHAISSSLPPNVQTVSSSQSASSKKLEPIQEVLSPELQKYQHLNDILSMDKSHESMKHLKQEICVSSTPHSDSVVSRGIYDIRNSTSPGSSNRKRMHAGKTTKEKGLKAPDPFTVYVSEDSKLSESVTSNHSNDMKNRPVQRTIPSSMNEYKLDSRILKIAESLNSLNSTSSIQDDSVNRDSSCYVSRHSLDSTKEQPSTTTSDGTSTLTAYTNDIPESSFRLSIRTEPPIVSPRLAKSNSRSSSGKIATRFPPNSSDRKNFAKPTKAEEQKNNDSSKEEHIPVPPTSQKAPPLGNVLNSHTNNSSILKAGTLNSLWQDFEKSYESDVKKESPVLKKLELFSKILSEQKQQRKAAMLEITTSSDSSYSFTKYPVKIAATKRSKVKPPVKYAIKITSTTDDATSPEENKKETHRKAGGIGTYRVEEPSVNKASINPNRNSKTSKMCPLCKRRSTGTNCPTPCSTDGEWEEPLMLQAWTQTSNKKQRNCDKYRPAEDSFVSSHSMYSDNATKRNSGANVKVAGEDKENDQNLINIMEKPEIKLERKATYIIRSPVKDDQNLQYQTHPVDVLHQFNILSEKKSGRDEVAYTAWFQTMQSDTSEIVPLCKVPSLNQLRINTSEKSKFERNIAENSYQDSLSLQEAFRLRKKSFMYRSKQRLQDIRDACLQDKHQQSNRLRVRKKNMEPKAPVTFAKKKLRLDRRPRKIEEENSPRIMFRLEEERQAVLRKNRLKMKQYDARLRQCFLKRQPKRKLRGCYVERH